MGPLALLYEIGIFLARFARPRSSDSETAEAMIA